MKIVSKAIGALLCAAMAAAVLLTGCTGEESSAASHDEPVVTAPVSTADEAIGGLTALGIDPSMLGIDPDIYDDKTHKPGFQLEPPQEGDEVAVIVTNYGDITLRLFPEQAPKTVTNFVNLAKDGKYNGTAFHRVINDFMIQGGHVGTDPDQPNGMSSYGDEFEDEFSNSLFNLRGAVSMASSAKDSNGSQFFINQTTPEAFKANGGWGAYDTLWGNIKTQLLNYKDSNLLSAFVEENGDKFINTDTISKTVKQLYVDNGGNPNLDGVNNAADRGNTVFAQVIDGMDVVDKIAAVTVNEDGVPAEDVVIKRIEIVTYTATADSAE